MALGTGNALRRLREDQGVSIRELERRTGINRGRLSMIERGIEPTAEELRVVVEALRPKPEEAA